MSNKKLPGWPGSRVCTSHGCENIEELPDAGLIARTVSRGNAGGRNAAACSIVRDASAFTYEYQGASCIIQT